MKKIKDCFTSEKINTGRQPEIDVAKGLAIIMMIICHAVITLSYEAEGSNGYMFADYVLGGPLVAPLFMISMGIGMVYSKHKSPEDYLKRGVILLGMGYLLNFNRGVLPRLFALAMGEPFPTIDALDLMFNIDILQFAGLSMMTIALLAWIKCSDLQIVIIALCCNALGFFLGDKSTGNIIGDIFAGLIWGVGEDLSAFPLLNWLIFPVFGYVFGKKMQYLKNKDRFYKTTFIITGSISIAYILYLVLSYLKIINPLTSFLSFSIDGAETGFYYLGTIEAIIFCSLALLVFSICYGLYRFTRRKNIWTPITGMSKRINTIYCIHWVLLAWIYVAVFDMSSIPLIYSYGIGIILILVSNILAKLWLQKKQEIRAKRV